jgi:hypothetical protein
VPVVLLGATVHHVPVVRLLPGVQRVVPFVRVVPVVRLLPGVLRRVLFVRVVPSVLRRVLRHVPDVRVVLLMPVLHAGHILGRSDGG